MVCCVCPKLSLSGQAQHRERVLVEENDRLFRALHKSKAEERTIVLTELATDTQVSTDAGAHEQTQAEVARLRVELATERELRARSEAALRQQMSAEIEGAEKRGEERAAAALGDSNKLKQVRTPHIHSHSHSHTNTHTKTHSGTHTGT